MKLRDLVNHDQSTDVMKFHDLVNQSQRRNKIKLHDLLNQDQGRVDLKSVDMIVENQSLNDVKSHNMTKQRQGAVDRWSLKNLRHDKIERTSHNNTPEERHRTLGTPDKSKARKRRSRAHGKYFDYCS